VVPVVGNLYRKLLGLLLRTWLSSCFQHLVSLILAGKQEGEAHSTDRAGRAPGVGHIGSGRPLMQQLQNHRITEC